ncbi:MAG TPA: putative glycoside hydrolase [Acidimicrobiales bacterium]
MKPPLTETPDSDPDAHRRGGGRRGRHRTTAPGGGRLNFAPRPIRWVESRPGGEAGGMFQAKRHLDVGLVLAMLFGLGTLVFVGVLVYRGTRVSVHQEGLDDGDALNGYEAAQMVVTIEMDSADKAEGATLTFDGEEVEDPERHGATLTWRPAEAPAEGDHALVLRAPRPLLGDAEVRWDFVVDSTPPQVDAPAVVDPVALDAHTAVSGRVERGATLTADGQEVEVGDDGSFTLEYTRPPAGPVTLEAVDRADNTTTRTVVMPVTYPGVQGVHVSGPAWESSQLRGGILQMIDEHRIDTVVLDLKDEGGTVHYDSQVPRARQIGAVSAFYDLDEAVSVLEARGVRVVGRISAFRDPLLAQAAWAAGQGDQVVQTPDGRPWAEPGQYTNFANAAVRRYNMDIALEAVGRGVDDILWDDARRPSGDPADMVIPGMTGSSSDAIVGFLAESHAELRRRGAYQGVTTDGAAADQGDRVGQDVARMAQNVDYVAPFVFPGYWSSGQYDVASPITQPGDLARRLVERYKEVMEGSGAVLVPWLQDFSVGGVGYGEGEVRAQIGAARAAHVNRILLWDTAVTYTGTALDPLPSG